MPRQRNYRAEYEARKQRAQAKGTTYGKSRYEQDKQRARREGFPSPTARARAARNERLRDKRIQDIFDQGGWEPGYTIPSRDETDRRIEGLMRRFGAYDAHIHDALVSEDRWQAFRAWYAVRMGWAA